MKIIKVGMADLKVIKAPRYINNSWIRFLCGNSFI